MSKRRTGILSVTNYDEFRFDLLTGHLEGNHPHWRGLSDGRWVVIEEDEAIAQARAGVPAVQDATRPLGKDGDNATPTSD